VNSEKMERIFTNFEVAKMPEVTNYEENTTTAKRYTKTKDLNLLNLYADSQCTA